MPWRYIRKIRVDACSWEITFLCSGRVEPSHFRMASQFGRFAVPHVAKSHKSWAMQWYWKLLRAACAEGEGRRRCMRARLFRRGMPLVLVPEGGTRLLEWYIFLLPTDPCVTHRGPIILHFLYLFFPAYVSIQMGVMWFWILPCKTGQQAVL